MKVVHLCADQLLPQFLLELFDIMPKSCRLIGHLHEEMLLQKIIFDKMTSMRTYTKFLVFLQVRAFTGRSTPTTVFDGTI